MFTPTKRGGGGGRTSFSHIEEGGGGHKLEELEVLAILKGGVQKGGARKVLPCLGGGGTQNNSDPQFSYFVAPSK